MSVERHPASPRLVHWTTAALVLSLLGLGLAMVDSLAPWRAAGVVLHKTGGLAVLLLTTVRVALRLSLRAGQWSPRRLVPPATTALPPATAVPRLQQRAAEATHVALYLLLLAVPLTGWAMQGAAGVPVRVFGRVILPPLVAESLVAYGVLREAHGWLTSLLLLAVLAHITGALHDGLVARRGLFQRMVV